MHEKEPEDAMTVSGDFNIQPGSEVRVLSELMYMHTHMGCTEFSTCLESN